MSIKDTIREAGGIVHSDGNIFFTNEAQFSEAMRLLNKAETNRRLASLQQLIAASNPRQDVLNHEGQLVFLNRASSEAEYWVDDPDLNCPACRGSGHMGDNQPVSNPDELKP